MIYRVKKGLSNTLSEVNKAEGLAGLFFPLAWTSRNNRYKNAKEHLIEKMKSKHKVITAILNDNDTYCMKSPIISKSIVNRIANVLQ